MTKLIALTGYSRSGKDTAADALVELGYTRCAFGDIIKAMVNEAPIEEFSLFRDWLESSGRDRKRVADIAHGWCLVKLCGVSPFTQNDEVKPLLRALLEDYGIWRYDEVTHRFFSTLPELCVNSRLCRAAEGHLWRQKGGILVEIVRPGNTAHTPVEAGWMQELTDAGLIDVILYNDSTPENLGLAIKQVASGTTGIIRASRLG